MDNEPNPFPEIRIVPTLKEVGSFLLRAVSFLPSEPLARGDHTFERPEAPVLPEQLYSE